MNNWTKVGLGGVVMAVVAAAFFWLAAQPETAPDFAPGSLGDTVNKACRPDAPLAGRDLDDALACRDLAAQESMAVSTARMVWLSWLQIAVGIGGSVAVVWTLFLTVRSAEDTRKALQHQQVATRRQLRPSLYPTAVEVREYTDNSGVDASFMFQNNGNSTAKNCKIACIVAVGPSTLECVLKPESLRFDDIARDVPRNGFGGYARHLDQSDYESIAAGNNCLQVALMATYEDEFGGKYFATSCRAYWGHKLTFDRLLPEFAFTEPELIDREA